MKDIEFVMIGTSQDVRLLKKIFNHYLKTKATESEKCHIETYICLIDHAVEKANKRCATCRWHKHEDIDDGYVCCNAGSVRVAEWTEDSDCCEFWECKC